MDPFADFISSIGTPIDRPTHPDRSDLVQRLENQDRPGIDRRDVVECDRLQCRLKLQAALREADRVKPRPIDRRDTVELDPTADALSNPPTTRKAYAPAPVGKPSDPRQLIPPDPSEVVHAMNYFQFTSAGSMIDLLV